MFPIVYFYKILWLLDIKFWKNWWSVREKIYFILIHLLIYSIYTKNINITCLGLKYKAKILTETLYNCYYRKLCFLPKKNGYEY